MNRAILARADAVLWNYRMYTEIYFVIGSSERALANTIGPGSLACLRRIGVHQPHCGALRRCGAPPASAEVS